MRGSVVVACALLALVAAPAARADVTIGSALTAVSDLAPDPAPGGYTMAPTAGVAPFDGVVTRWRVRAALNATQVRLRVLRLTPTERLEVGRSAQQTPSQNATSVYAARIPIAAGDRIALECCTDGNVGELLIADAPSSDLWNPAIGDGQTVPVPTLPLEPVTVQVNADIERDDDTDGHGDETQDNCPAVSNAVQADLDRDAAGDACDGDDDGDGAADGADNCPRVANPGQEDTDGDVVGDACDADDDNDGLADAADVCPRHAGPAPQGCPLPPAAPRVNQPPTVRFKTPLSGTAIGASQTIELEVSDDAGIRSVGVFDDDGTICMLTAAPYTCTWEPTGADVGRATLLASAVDSDGRSTLGIVRVRVGRFGADLTLRRKGRRVRGRLVLPAAVERSLGCRGDVTVRRKRVRRTVALKRNCTYKARLPRGRGKPRARFAGNAVVAPATLDA